MTPEQAQATLHEMKEKVQPRIEAMLKHKNVPDKVKAGLRNMVALWEKGKLHDMDDSNRFNLAILAEQDRPSITGSATPMDILAKLDDIASETDIIMLNAALGLPTQPRSQARFCPNGLDQNLNSLVGQWKNIGPRSKLRKMRENTIEMIDDAGLDIHKPVEMTGLTRYQRTLVNTYLAASAALGEYDVIVNGEKQPAIGIYGAKSLIAEAREGWKEGESACGQAKAEAVDSMLTTVESLIGQIESAQARNPPAKPTRTTARKR